MRAEFLNTSLLPSVFSYPRVISARLMALNPTYTLMTLNSMSSLWLHPKSQILLSYCLLDNTQLHVLQVSQTKQVQNALTNLLLL